MERIPKQITCLYWAEGYKGRTKEQKENNKVINLSEKIKEGKKIEC